MNWGKINQVMRTVRKRVTQVSLHVDVWNSLVGTHRFEQFDFCTFINLLEMLFKIQVRLQLKEVSLWMFSLNRGLVEL
jgi:hypothetical protein